MATKRAGKASGARKSDTISNNEPPVPFKKAPDSLEPFFDQLSARHVYIAHIDSKPASFKRKIFSVPVLMNIGVVLLFALRVWYIGPYYYLLLQSALGTANATTYLAKDLSWNQLISVIFRRGFTFMLDLTLCVFVWPWPIEFCFGTTHGNPVGWRMQVGFRDKEIYVRRSRSWYSSTKNSTISDDAAGSNSGATTKMDLVNDENARRLLVAHISQATSPLLTQQKTGYLTMDGNWDLDWNLMVLATHLVDKKELALEAFTSLTLLHHDDYGWLTVDLRSLGGGVGSSASSGDDDIRRRQVFAFRDALAAIGKEDLFFRWIEIIQFEATRPGGLGDAERQAIVAKEVRDVFQENGVDFDQLWADSVGTEGLHGM
ncbi:uncharacterized protein SPSK_10413 [Sporothrix schenckii 1099-18]|uniref:Uncharacterized protein n=2 Tax=Sporothrix schenckii TaxID=29908 RepID=U7PKL8_SPOS1|nr:uncharacterized protein SPSK_10413 [Sporothrix schenckii 1099-18]ERS95446.1 hypothetical protein HMPREF1624_08324 [Sporothrix schenckii ATCC 58251]KJR87416.1 hypothetical protein SPSK_10413 [Sporothrix schenckii 1099-18]